MVEDLLLLLFYEIFCYFNNYTPLKCEKKKWSELRQIIDQLRFNYVLNNVQFINQDKRKKKIIMSDFLVRK